MPVSWSANSQQLFYLGDEGDLYRLDGIPQPSGPPTNLTTGIGPISAATTTPDGHVLIARQEANTYIIQHFDPVPRGIDMRFVGIGPTPTAMSLDANDRLLLRFSGGADGSLSVQDGSSTDQSGPSAGQPGTDLPHLIHGVHGAAWIPGATSTSPATPTTGPSTTTSPNAVIIPTPTTATAPVAQVPAVTAIGDSVMLGAGRELSDAIDGRTGAGTVRVDATEDRQLADAVELVRQYRKQHLLGNEVIVHLGTNGPVEALDFERLMNALDGVPHVIIVNVYVPRPWEQEVNDTLAAGVAARENAVLVDWHSYGDAHPELFYDDGIHLTPDGAKAYAQLIAAAVAAPSPTK